MALYIVVHHARDTEQPWANAWIDDERLQAITTRKDLGRLCHEALTAAERVYVYRCQWGSHDSTVCCSARVAAVADIDGGAYVMFEDQSVCGHPPPRPAGRGEIYFTGPPPRAA